jgi:hypothetical protein
MKTLMGESLHENGEFQWSKAIAAIPKKREPLHEVTI